MGSPALSIRAMDEPQQGSPLPVAAVSPFVHPPRLEDAGLEDCALPPESIMEAFARAAVSARPAVDEDGSDDERSDEDGASGANTVVVGAGAEMEPPPVGLSVLCEEVSDPGREERGKERKEEERSS